MVFDESKITIKMIIKMIIIWRLKIVIFIKMIKIVIVR